MKDRRVLFWALVALYAMFALWAVKPACAERIRDLATIQGVRSNALIGYGLVAGLDGSGDQTTQTPFTRQSLANMLSQLGVTIPPGTNMQLRNIAAVMVTAELPPYARPGQKIDVVVSSLGNAKSLRGGTLIMSPLKGADGQVYALAQGNVLVGGAGVSANRSRAQVNQLAVGSISGGATVERMVETAANSGDTLSLELNSTDFGTARRVVDALNGRFGSGTAQAVDARAISVRAPADASARVDFIARIQEVDVNPAQPRAKVVLNSRTGSIVMNQAVALRSVAVAHGNLSVRVDTQPVISQPNPFSGGNTVVTEQSEVSLRQDGGKMQMVQGAASLADVVKALNALGATPADLMSILQAMKSADALRADLEII